MSTPLRLSQSRWWTVDEWIRFWDIVRVVQYQGPFSVQVEPMLIDGKPVTA